MTGFSTIKLPLPEQIIAGRYRLISRLGSGGMGLVFLAEQLGVGNRVAIKFLDPEPNADDSRIARFLREAKVALEVKHPGAAQLLDLGRDDAHRLYLVFEYVEGEDLRDLIRSDGRLHFDEARAIALKVAEALAFAHERHIVHRDVKPENIRVRRDLAQVHVKVLDFGIAALLKDGGVRLTAEGSLAGTPRYMSPEQIRDTPVDGRTDCYALGLVLYEMLTGAPAFAGKNISQILVKQVSEPLPLLRSVDAELNFPVVDDFLSRACAKDANDRFASMADFVMTLRSLPVTRWPAPRKSVAQSTAPTRDLRPAAKGLLSDTAVRVENPTDVVGGTSHDDEAPRPHAEVPTEPEREPVGRRMMTTPRSPPPVMSAARPAAAPVVAAPRAAPVPKPLNKPGPPVAAPHAPPPKPVVAAAPRIIAAATVVGGVPAPRPPPRAKRKVWPWVLGLLLGLGAAVSGVAWWMGRLLH